MARGRVVVTCVALACVASQAVAGTPHGGIEVRAGYAVSPAEILDQPPEGGLALSASATWRVTRTSKFACEAFDSGMGRIALAHGDSEPTPRSRYADCSVAGVTLAWRQDLATAPPPTPYVLAGAGLYGLRIVDEVRSEGASDDTAPGFVLAAGFHGRGALTPVLDFRIHVVPAHDTSNFIFFTNHGTDTFQLFTVSFGLAWR